MSKLVKKLLISILLSLYLILNFIPTTHAQSVLDPNASTPWYAPNPQQFYVKVYDPTNPTEIFGERYTAAQVQWIVLGFWSMIINWTGDIKTNYCIMAAQTTGNVADCAKLLGDKIKNDYQFDKYIAYLEGKTIPNLIFEDRSLSAITYFKDIIRKFHIIPEAQAQAGVGYDALSPIQPLWQAARNITYTLFVVIIMVMAFMIMFRVKISPQAIITVQSALPKLVMAIILVTFSYAIAGFIVDLMYVIMGLISIILSLAGGGSDPVKIFGFLTQFPLGVIGLIAIYLLLLISAILALMVATFQSNGVLGIVGGVVAGFLLFLLLLVIIIVSLYIAIKTIWLLVKATVSVLLLTVAGPFEIAFGTIASGLSVTSWIRKLVANLAVFPVVSLFFFLCFMFLTSVIQDVIPLSSVDSQIFKDLLGFFGKLPLGTSNNREGWPPLLSLGGNQSNWLFLAIAVVIYLLIPKVADIIKSAIEGKPFAFGTAIGEGLEPARLKFEKDELTRESSINAGRIVKSPVGRANFFRGLGIVKTPYKP